MCRSMHYHFHSLILCLNLNEKKRLQLLGWPLTYTPVSAILQSFYFSFPVYRTNILTSLDMPSSCKIASDFYPIF